MHSQRDEDEKIAEFFGGRVGRFLDVGAWDGKAMSNTWLLAQKGWSGVCVEPAALPFLKLLRNHRKNPRVECVQAAIMPEAGVSRFWYTADAISSFDEKHVETWLQYPRVKYRSIWAAHVTFDDLLRALPGPYDFVSIDAEGYSVKLLPFFDPTETRTELVCVEYDGRRGDVLEWAKKYGMVKIHQTAENLLVGLPTSGGGAA